MKKIISTSLILSLMLISVSAATFSAKEAAAKTPQTAARGLYLAWQAKNFKSAIKFAYVGAVDKLFEVKRHPMTFNGCSKNDDGDFECIYKNTKLDLSFAMIVKKISSGYRVESISFSSEAI
jgi:hypothetical protein